MGSCLTLLFGFVLFALAMLPPHTTAPSGKSTAAEPAQRVVIIAPLLTGYVTIDQGTAHVVGASRAARDVQAGMPELLQRIFPGLAAIPSVSDNQIIDPEAVLLADPDALFVYQGTADVWRALAIPGIHEIRLGPGPQSGRKRDIWISMGEVAGKRERTAALAERADHLLANVESAVSGSLPVKSMSLSPDAGGGWTLDGRFNMFSDKIAQAGGMLVGGSYTATLDPELLLLHDPDVLFINATSAETDEIVQNVLLAPALQPLRAVRERRVYATPAFTFLNEPVEDPILVGWLAETLHPERMSCLTRELVRSTYEEVYEHPVSEADIDAVLRLDRNAGSQGYARFQRGACRH